MNLVKQYCERFGFKGFLTFKSNPNSYYQIREILKKRRLERNSEE